MGGFADPDSQIGLGSDSVIIGVLCLQRVAVSARRNESCLNLEQPDPLAPQGAPVLHRINIQSRDNALRGGTHVRLPKNQYLRTGRM